MVDGNAGSFPGEAGTLASHMETSNFKGTSVYEFPWPYPSGYAGLDR